MAIMVDKKSEYKGEGKVWDSFSEKLPDSFVIYNQREINGREYDFCIMSENMGIIIVEVKGWLSDKIIVNGIDEIDVEGYDKPQTSPKKQARAYRFAILNKISEKYNISPLVLDMVCYPFITEQDYRDCHLDIISEPEYTIFKGDLEDKELLNNKLIGVFQKNNVIPHSDFTYDLMIRIRKSLEPNLKEEVEDNRILPYSKLYIYPSEVAENEINELVLLYFCGVKSVIFVKDLKDYESIIQALLEELKNHNVSYKKNNLYVGCIDDESDRKDSDCFRIFNFELYKVNDLNEFCNESIQVREGVMDSNIHDILLRLSDSTSFNIQQFDIEHATTEKDILVEAGAGTGKTFSMVSRIAYLCNKEENPVSNIAEEIAMVTFTNDAATNMKKRLKQMFVNYFVLTGKEKYLKFVEDVDRSYISTIHKFAIGIMRNESLYTGLGTNFRITENEYKRGKAYDLYLGAYLEEKETENSNFVNEIPVPIYELKKKLMAVADKLFAKSVNYSQIKKSEMGVTVDNNIPYFNELLLQVVFPAETLYSESLRNSNDIDLKESLIELGKVLSADFDVIEDLRLRFLFIDEFQDTDDVQIEIFQKLQKCINADCRLFVVGDLKQSIYRFRGAKLNAFQKLQNGKTMDWSHHRLNRNYRTDGRLLELFDEVFVEMGEKNILPYAKADDCLKSDVITDAEENELFVELPCHGKDEEALLELLNNTVLHEVEKIKNLMNSKKLSKEERTIAILVRSNWQVERILKAAAKKDINVEISSGGDLFQLPSSLDLYKLVLALIHSTSPVHLVSFIDSNYSDLKLDYQKLRGMKDAEKSDALLSVLDEFFKRRMGTTWQGLLEEVYSQPILFVLKKIVDALKPWENYSRLPDKKRLYIANYEFLIEKMISFARIDTLTLNQVSEYLSINILTGQQQLARTADVDDEGIHIICTTVHKSKGLEYGTVILPYTFEELYEIKRVKLDATYNDNNLAYTVLFENGVRERNSNFNENKEIKEQIEEEARILYVALTRTIRNCIWINNIDSNSQISWAKMLEG